LRANNNKVFMEVLKKIYLSQQNNLKSSVYGSLEEVDFENIIYPVVFKNALGSMSQGVSLARDQIELYRIIKANCRTRNIKQDIRDYIRSIKRKGYVRESLYRSKFILQQFIPNLDFDFKVLVFGEKFYIVQRNVRKNDFRASGSGLKNYAFGSKVKYPAGIFDFALSVFKKFNIPHLSLDIAYDGSHFYLLEFQVVYFGTAGVDKSDGYFSKKGNEWVFNAELLSQEKVYADSIGSYIKNSCIITE